MIPKAEKSERRGYNVSLNMRAQVDKDEVFACDFNFLNIA